MDRGQKISLRAGALAACAAVSGALASVADAWAQEKPAEEGWRFTISAGSVYAPSYLGDDAYQLRALPGVSVKYGDRFFASLQEGVGYNIVNSHGWRVGPVAKYHFGRDEDGASVFAVVGDDTDDLIGLGDVDGSIELGGFVEYKYAGFTGAIELRQGIGGHEGLIGEAELKYVGKLALQGPPLIYSFGPKLIFAGDSYASAFFGVNAAQSAASGLAEFDAGGGLLSYGFHGSLVLPIDRHVSVVGFAGVDILSGDAADSSLVQERGAETQGVGGFFLNYTF